MEHQPFTIAQMRPIRDCMTVSRPANLGKEVPVTWVFPWGGYYHYAGKL